MRKHLVPGVVFVVWMNGFGMIRAATYQEEVLADKPFVYYGFNESVGTDTAEDLSGNGHDGEYVDVELGEASFSDALGTAGRFDGFSSLVEVPALDFESDQFTIETWLNVDFITGRCCTSVFSPTGWQPGWVHYNLGEPGRVEFALNSGGPNDRWTFDDALPLEEWAHVVSTYDLEEAIARIWINGEEEEYTPAGFNSPQTVTLIVESQIGAWQNSRYLSGAIDEFAIYDTVLSDERILSHWKAANGTGVPGDFNNDGALDATDVNELVWKIASGMNEAGFDLDGNTKVDEDDLRVWIKDLRVSWFGDANLDGEFNSSDFVDVFQAGKFEQDVDANWSEGDWTGDHRFSSSDFVVAFQDGGFELGPRQVAQAVPEPTSIGLLMIAIVTLAIRGRSNR